VCVSSSIVFTYILSSLYYLVVIRWLGD